MRTIPRWRICSLVGASALVVAELMSSGCSGPRELDRSCTTDADCKIVDDCCAGCTGIRVDEEIDACESTCFQSACDARFGGGTGPIEAFCSSGMCDARIGGG